MVLTQHIYLQQKNSGAQRTDKNEPTENTTKLDLHGCIHKLVSRFTIQRSMASDKRHHYS